MIDSPKFSNSIETSNLCIINGNYNMSCLALKKIFGFCLKKIKNCQTIEKVLNFIYL